MERIESGKKVALVLYIGDDCGGAERRLIRLYNSLGKSHNVELIIRGCTEDIFFSRLEKADCSIDCFQKISFFRGKIACLMYMIFSEFYNIHYFDLCGFNNLIAEFMKWSKTKTLLTIAYQNYAYGLVETDVKKKLSKLINNSSKVDVLFPVGELYLKSISKNKNISVTPGTFTNVEKFRPRKKQRILLFAAARLEKDKNADLLVEACNLCKKALRECSYKVIIAGKNFEENCLRNKINKYNLEDVVHMPGYIKMSEIIPKAEVFFSLDLIDNYPSQAVAEAVSCGCVLMCTDVGYSRRCGSKEFSYYIKNDSNELAKVIISYLSKDNREKEMMSREARKYAEKYYSIENSKKYFERLIWGE